MALRSRVCKFVCTLLLPCSGSLVGRYPEKAAVVLKAGISKFTLIHTLSFETPPYYKFSKLYLLEIHSFHHWIYRIRNSVYTITSKKFPQLGGVKMDSKKIGNRIREARKAAKMTQADLAQVVHLSPKYVSNIECGNKLPKFETFVHIANALKTDANSLLVDVLDVAPQIWGSTLPERLSQLPTVEQERLLRLFSAMIEESLR